MPTVAGVDSSTQSCKVMVCDADTGEVLAERSAPHPDGTECPPQAWWQALDEMRDLTAGVDAIGVAGQQHGMVTLDASDEVVRPALLWNDTRSAAAADRLVAELGEDAWAERVGLVPVASFTISKLAWLAEHEPENAGRVARVLLPHDYLTWELSGRNAFVTDRGDASGTGYWSPRTGSYDTELLKLGFGRVPELPEVSGPADVVGETPSGALLSAGTGDNMGAALGLGTRPGDVVVSLGTSGTVFAVHSEMVVDSTGVVAGFADATGRFLPLVCTLNAARVLDSTANLLGVDSDGLDRLALSAEPGAGGLSLLPYLDGERTPNLPDAAGSVHHMRRDTMTRENLARAAVEGMLCGLADGLRALTDHGAPVERILLIGGAARSAAVRASAPTVFGAPVAVPSPAQYVALGAARQAAWALRGGPEPPEWTVGETEVYEDVDVEAGERIRAAYREARDGLYG